MKISPILASALALVALEKPAVANYLTAPVFDSAPAVITSSVSQSYIPDGTVIFGTHNGSFNTVARLEGEWWFGPSELLSLGVPGGYDSGPAATYLDSPRIMICGHAAGGPGHFYCAFGQVSPQFTLKTFQFPVDASPAPAGPGTFNAGANPAVLRVGSEAFLFGRGQDAQIWFATVNATGVPTWHGWWQIPPFSGGFSSDPAAVAVDGNGSILVCAQANYSMSFMCNKRSPNGTWGGWLTIFTESTLHRPAMVRTSNALWFLDTGTDALVHEFGRYSVDGGVVWSSPIQVGLGTGFLSGPAGVASLNSSSIFTVNRGGDSRFWYTWVGSQGWTQLQAWAFSN